MECNLCGGEWPDEVRGREVERCPWCLNPVEADGELVGEDWKDRSAVVRAKETPPLYVGAEEEEQDLSWASYWPDMRTVRIDAAHATPLEAHRLARWILGNVDLPDGEMP